MIEDLRRELSVVSSQPRNVNCEQKCQKLQEHYEKVKADLERRCRDAEEDNGRLTRELRASMKPPMLPDGSKASNPDGKLQLQSQDLNVGMCF